MADNGQKMPGIGEPEQKQKRLFKYKRAGVELSENEVQEIKAGRKRLRADLRAAGIKSKKDFELTASLLDYQGRLLTTEKRQQRLQQQEDELGELWEF